MKRDPNITPNTRLRCTQNISYGAASTSSGDELRFMKLMQHRMGYSG